MRQSQESAPAQNRPNEETRKDYVAPLVERLGSVTLTTLMKSGTATDGGGSSMRMT